MELVVKRENVDLQIIVENNDKNRQKTVIQNQRKRSLEQILLSEPSEGRNLLTP
jgi:hypothetical protein